MDRRGHEVKPGAKYGGGGHDLMELTGEQRAKVEEIASGLKYAKDFKCCESGFEELCRAVDSGAESHLICLEDSANLCRFRVVVGSFNLCMCPPRGYIARNIEE